MKDRRLLGIRAWVWGVALASFVAAGTLVVLWISDGTAVVAETPEAAPKPAPAVEDPRRDEPDFSAGPLPPVPEEMADESPVFVEVLPDFESDLLVTLPGQGKISIERYDKDGNPTGEPLKSGTQVQIPDPNRPGEKIFFRVP